MKNKPKYWQCKLNWGWGCEHSFSESSEFSIYDMDELDKKVKEKLVKIARRYAMDGDKDMRVWVNSVDIIPVYESRYIWASDMGWEVYLANEVEFTRELTKNKLLYTEAGNYNSEISPKNRGE
jgi:hypothetical protein